MQIRYTAHVSIGTLYWVVRNPEYPSLPGALMLAWAGLLAPPAALWLAPLDGNIAIASAIFDLFDMRAPWMLGKRHNYCKICINSWLSLCLLPMHDYSGQLFSYWHPWSFIISVWADAIPYTLARNCCIEWTNTTHSQQFVSRAHSIRLEQAHLFVHNLVNTSIYTLNIITKMERQQQ